MTSSGIGPPFTVTTAFHKLAMEIESGIYPIILMLFAKIRQTPAAEPSFFGGKTKRGGRRVNHQIPLHPIDRKSTRLNSSHVKISYAVYFLKKKKFDTIS